MVLIMIPEIGSTTTSMSLMALLLTENTFRVRVPKFANLLTHHPHWCASQKKRDWAVSKGLKKRLGSS
jgi:hypothetical protein